MFWTWQLCSSSSSSSSSSSKSVQHIMQVASMHYVPWYLLNRCVFSELVATQHWITQIVRQTVSGHRASNRKRLTTELAVKVLWYDQQVAASRMKMLTTGDIGCENAAVYKVLQSPSLEQRWTVTASLYWIRSGSCSQCSSEWCNCIRAWSNFLDPLTTRAATFITRWSLSMVDIGDPANTTLQLSTRECVNQCFCCIDVKWSSDPS